jgi:riboflavin synthase
LLEGTKINLERSLKMGDELGGHLVSGHIDCVATVAEVRPDGDSSRFTFKVPAGFAKFIAEKGSVAIDGVSLTVNEVSNDSFGVNIIPHTCAVTTFDQLKQGHKVNIEIDMLARYVARLLNPA